MKILDIGAGFGYLYNAFDKTDIKADSFYATDPSPDNLERLKAKGVNAFSSLAELNQRGFDLVTLCYVLEHINDPYQFMISVMDYVKDGGYVFIDLPERDDTFKPVLEPHVAVYTAESLKHLANKLGFKIIHLTGYGVKRSDLIAQTSAKRNLINRFENVFGRIANKIHRRDDVQKLYKQYKFNEEGEGRWWIRAVLRKK
jgi:SAM-dependent methyltransferase